MSRSCCVVSLSEADVQVFVLRDDLVSASVNHVLLGRLQTSVDQYEYLFTSCHRTDFSVVQFLCSQQLAAVQVSGASMSIED